MGITKADLHREIAAYSESWSELDPVADSDQLESQLTAALRAYRRIHAADNAWSSAVSSGAIDFDAEDARFIEGLYRQWLAVADRAIAALDRRPPSAAPIDLEKEFRQARQRVLCALSTPLDRILLSAGSPQRHRRSLGELRNALQRRV